MSERPDQLNDFDSLEPSATFSHWWQRPWGLALIALGGLATFILTCCLSPVSWIKGETDIFGHYTFIKERQQAAEAQEGMELVHAQLLPNWLIELANTPPGERAHVETFAPLRASVEHDELLAGILDKIHAILISDNLTEKGGDLLQLGWAWNQRLVELDEPFYIQGNIVSTSQGTTWLAESYRILANSTVTAAEIPVDILIVERIDSTNVYETYSGLASAGATEAIVIVDRTFDRVVKELWPLLDGQKPATTNHIEETVEAVMLDAILAEFQQHLRPEHIERLLATAPLRRQLAQTVAEINGRRSCGSTTRLQPASWNGYNPLTLDRLSAWARHDRLESCPRATYKEADLIRDISRTLQRDQTLKHALEALLALLTRSTAIHEARHIADDQLTNGLEVPLDCTLCPDSMSTSARAELSAYLASFAWGDTPHTSFFLACMANVSGASRPHRQALGFALRHLETLCDAPPPADLTARARALEQTLFNRSQPVTLPTDYPTRVSIQYH